MAFASVFLYEGAVSKLGVMKKDVPVSPVAPVGRN